MKKILQLLFLLICSYSFAQTAFEKGYYVNNSGLKVDGYIKNIDWRYNPTDFEFKNQLTDSDSKVVTIKDASEFGIENYSKFKRYTVAIERSFTETGKLKKQKSPDFKNETLFLKTLNEGDANLYSYKDGPFVKYFYETKSIPLEQLVYIRYLTLKGDATENNQFRQQLYNNVRNEKTSEDNIKRIKYSESELKSHFEKFNDSGITESKKYERKNNVKPFSLGITAGVSFATVDFKNVEAAKFNKTIFKLGIEAEYILPFNNNSWAIFVNPNYSKFEGTKDFQLYDGLYASSPPSENVLDINYTMIDIPMGIRYYVHLNKSSRLFLDAAYIVSATLGEAKIAFNNSEASTYDISSANNLRLGFGYSYKKISAALKYNTNREILNEYVYSSGDYNSIDLILGYRFL